jgi:hypothetical protein
MADKLKFIPCGDDVNSPSPQEGAAYTVKVNPEQVTHSRDVSINESPANTGGNATVFTGYGNDTLSFDLYFDGTGVIDGTGDVDSEITALKKVIFDLKDTLHKPQYILVMWGNIKFYGHCKSFNVNYTLFKSDGSPLRAKVSVSLKESLDPEKKKKRDEQSSPDMTHTFTIREGDALPLLCKEVYGRMDYYVQVAEFNGLTNFRELEVGSVLNFPPLER